MFDGAVFSDTLGSTEGIGLGGEEYVSLGDSEGSSVGSVVGDDILGIPVGNEDGLAVGTEDGKAGTEGAAVGGAVEGKAVGEPTFFSKSLVVGVLVVAARTAVGESLGELVGDDPVLGSMQ